MPDSRLIDHSRARGRGAWGGLLALAGGALLAAFAWSWLRPGEAPAEPSAPLAATAPRAVAAAPSATGDERAVATPTGVPSPSPDCPHHRLDIAAAGGHDSGCVGSLRISQSGSVRRYTAEAEGTSSWTLQVDAAGGRVVAATLRHARRGSFSCRNETCRGLEIGRPDRHGLRMLSIDGAALAGRIDVAAPVGPDGRSIVPMLQLSARLAIPPDAQVLALACPMPALRIVESDGAFSEFCPRGGIGFETDDEQRWRYRFSDLEGHDLVVTLDAAGALLAVQYGAYACRAPACGSVGSEGGERPGEETRTRRFAFSALQLETAAASGARRHASIDGELAVLAP